MTGHQKAKPEPLQFSLLQLNVAVYLFIIISRFLLRKKHHFYPGPLNLKKKKKIIIIFAKNYRFFLQRVEFITLHTLRNLFPACQSAISR